MVYLPPENDVVEHPRHGAMLQNDPSLAADTSDEYNYSSRPVAANGRGGNESGRKVKKKGRNETKMKEAGFCIELPCCFFIHANPSPS